MPKQAHPDTRNTGFAADIGWRASDAILLIMEEAVVTTPQTSLSDAACDSPAASLARAVRGLVAGNEGGPIIGTLLSAFESGKSRALDRTAFTLNNYLGAKLDDDRWQVTGGTCSHGWNGPVCLCVPDAVAWDCVPRGAPRRNKKTQSGDVPEPSPRLAL